MSNHSELRFTGYRPNTLQAVPASPVALFRSNRAPHSLTHSQFQFPFRNVVRVITSGADPRLKFPIPPLRPRPSAASLGRGAERPGRVLRRESPFGKRGAMVRRARKMQRERGGRSINGLGNGRTDVEFHSSIFSIQGVRRGTCPWDWDMRR